MEIITKRDLRRNFETYLESGVLTPKDKAALLEGRTPESTIAMLSTSGTTHQALLIPKTMAEIKYILTRSIKIYNQYIAEPINRIALLGGISHIEAAKHIRFNHVNVKHFEIDDIEALNEFNPEAISCYPSVMRELIHRSDFNPRALKVFKLGGESVFPSDVTKVYRRFPELMLFEVYGSTEMPVVAYRMFQRGQWNDTYNLETERYSFYWQGSQGWQPMLIKDNFKDRALMFDGYFDMGDEALLKDNKVIQIKRRNGANAQLYTFIDSLYEQGCINLQLDLENQTIHYTGDTELPTTVSYLGKTFLTERVQMERTPLSNKLALFI